MTPKITSKITSEITSKLPHQRWKLHPVKPEVTAQVATATGLLLPVAQVLLNRGMVTPTLAKVFLDPEALILPSPLEAFTDLAASLELLATAIEHQQKIAICGDYDADGMTSTALLLRALRALGAQVDYAIPSRMQEGYGINQRIVEAFHAEGVRVILTVDNGIAALEPIARARELNLAVIVTDHHDLPPQLPPANAILNPKMLPETSPYWGLAGVGVAYILAISLAQQLGKLQDFVNPLLELFTLGTIADLAPLTGVNRRWVRRGLARLPHSQIPGVQALIEVSALKFGVRSSEFGVQKEFWSLERSSEFGVAPKETLRERSFSRGDATRTEFGKGNSEFRVAPKETLRVDESHPSDKRSSGLFELEIQNFQIPDPNSQLPTPNSQLPTPNPQLRTPNPEPQTPNPEPQTPNPELRTPNPELRTPNPEPQTPNSELRTNSLRPDDIGFRLGPRINAIGRIGDPQVVIELLTTDDPAIAWERAVECELANQKRRQLCEEIEQEAIALCDPQVQTLKRSRVLLVMKPGWHHGVIGIVASRLVERYGVPVFIATGEGETHIRGSARSIPEFHVFEALEACKDLLEKHGGHRAAGGFSLLKENLAAFQQRLIDFACQCLDPKYLKPLVMLDGEIRLAEINEELYQQIDALHPWGIENPEPIFWSAKVRVLEQRLLGKNKQHLKLLLGSPLGEPEQNIRAIAWRWGDYYPLPICLDVAYRLRENHWQGQTTIELEIIGVRLPQAAPIDSIPADPILSIAQPHEKPKLSRQTALNSKSPTATFDYQNRSYSCAWYRQNDRQELRIRNGEGQVLVIQVGENRGLLGMNRDTAKEVDLDHPYFAKLIDLAERAIGDYGITRGYQSW
jgi:single-stranded-DNA-specific exonuclease